MTQSSRHYRFIDQICLAADQALRTLTGGAQHNNRPYPATAAEATLTTQERRLSSGFMRVNHTGEICAQALYQAQGLISQNRLIKASMANAAREEGDHLAWCLSRLTELQAQPSLLNPLWYAGAFSLGAIAACIGDSWNLGFLAETEQQVVAHLANHLATLSPKDQRSRQILAVMQADELQHHDEAKAAGGKDLPAPIKLGMRSFSKIMVTVAYWI